MTEPTHSAALTRLTLIVGRSPTELWGLSSEERFERYFRRAGIATRAVGDEEVTVDGVSAVIGEARGALRACAIG